MGISVREFEVAMETLGGHQVTPKEDIFLGVPHLRYEIDEIFFEHSGEECIFLIPSNPRAMELLKLAKFQLNCTHSTVVMSSNKIYSIKELVILGLIISHKYSSLNLKKYLNQTYEVLQRSPFLRKSISNNYRGGLAYDSSEVYRLVDNFDKSINPFLGYKKTKKASSYLGNLEVNFKFNNHSSKSDFSLCLAGKISSAEYTLKGNTISYYAEFLNDLTGESYTGYTSVEHRYWGDSKDEFLEFHFYAEDSSIIILNLTTGMVKVNDDIATPATEEILKLIVDCLKTSIQSISSTITNYILA